MELLVLIVSLLLCSCLLFINLANKVKVPVFMESLRNKHVLITGGSSGIGLAIARRAIEEQAFVTLVSRSASNLADAVEKLVEGSHCSRDRIRCQAADVGDYSAIATAVKEATRWRPVDVMVCNAGITRGGYLDNSEVEDLDLIIRTNLNGTVYALHEALPSLKERSVEHPVSIVIVSSMVSLYFLYGHAVYTATKYALRGLAEGLRAELLPYNIRVSLVCPGFVNTSFLDEAMKDVEITEIMRKVNVLDRENFESPESVAAVTMDTVKRGSSVVVTKPIGMHLLALARGLTPADNLWTNLFEVAFMVPFRFFSLKCALDTRRSILEGVNKGFKK